MTGGCPRTSRPTVGTSTGCSTSSTTITGITAILVFATMIAFLVMYKDRPGRRARYTHGNTTLEIVWTVVPSLILVVLTFLSVPAWSKIKMQAPPPSDFVLQVTAKQFNWQITYPGPDGKFGTGDDKTLLDEMHVPVNKVVHVHLTLPGRHPQLLRAPVPHEAGRGARARDRAVVRGDQARQVRAALRRAVRLRPLRHEGLDLRARRRGLQEVGGREPHGRRGPGRRREESRGAQDGDRGHRPDGRKSQAMSATTATAHAHTAHEHHELGFVRKYIFSTDHKIIGIQFLFTGLI